MDLIAHAARLEPHLDVVMPDGTGPFPVSLQFHGCGGIFPMQREYAEAARDAGVAVVIVDSFAPRGIGALEARAAVCTGLKFRGAERATDVLAMLDWIGGQPWVDTRRISAAGWSHGAWALMEALTGAALPLTCVSLFYPYCGPLSHTASRGWGANRPRVYACLGGRDLVVGRTLPERALRRLRTDGLDVRSILLEEATHGFDEDMKGDPRVRYRPDLAEIARGFYVEALTESLGLQASSQTTPARASV